MGVEGRQHATLHHYIESAMFVCLPLDDRYYIILMSTTPANKLLYSHLMGLKIKSQIKLKIRSAKGRVVTFVADFTVILG